MLDEECAGEAALRKWRERMRRCGGAGILVTPCLFIGSILTDSDGLVVRAAILGSVTAVLLLITFVLTLLCIRFSLRTLLMVIFAVGVSTMLSLSHTGICAWSA